MKTIDSFFKPKRSRVVDLELQPDDAPAETSNACGHAFHEDEPPLKSPRQELNEKVDTNSLIRDPGLGHPIRNYPVDQRDEIRRAYIKLGPYQLHKSKYPLTGPIGHRRSFQESWFKNFFWLEYSERKDAAYCLPCYLFTKKPIDGSGSDTFTEKGFNIWKKVNNGKQCAFVIHEGNNPGSAHKYSVQCYENLKNQLCGIKTKMNNQPTPQKVLDNRLRLKTSIEAIKWLTFQGCAFRGHNERADSRNQGNFLELIKLLASYNTDVNGVVLENAPGNAKYIASDIQKEILLVYSMKVQAAIREKIGNAKFCLIVDEARDESKKEQMAIVIRFVDLQGYVKERFLDLIHVKNTCALTLKTAILSCLAYHKLDAQDIHGQGYDGASNMRGEWNGLQALILDECPYAYYVHCLAYQLQLALVAASKDVTKVHTFF